MCSCTPPSLRVVRYRKRGIALTPVKFGMSFTAVFMNQTGALVHVYTDGTVLVSHGGTEMGQVCAYLGNTHGMRGACGRRGLSA